ncbi:MAG TPA: tRNA uridine-5-carboxymethylaminomethyl(34) synthesis GTPase MnmE, partial [Planctomycetes bacterium]|nr:tRNA uridine-5-carboxymethylaminomethyl(34) synthesis GTPase MnmE [Planctomycetota bacterium]
MPDTIVALSSPVGPAPRAVVRLSGPRARELARSLLPDALDLRPWRLTPSQLRLPDWPSAPCAVLSCPAPRSYTGEDVVELWVPGAPPLVRRLLVTLQERGARLADRGEFTRRAFLGGRLSLLEVEAVLALTSAADAEASRAALRVLEGGVGAELEALKQALLDLRAHVEAAIDFSEEELDLADEEQLARRLERLAAT